MGMSAEVDVREQKQPCKVLLPEKGWMRDCGVVDASKARSRCVFYNQGIVRMGNTRGAVKVHINICGH